MVRAWYMDNTGADQREPHRPADAAEVSLEDLAKLGVLYWKLDADKYEEEGKLAEIRDERGYNYTDTITVSPERLPNYEQKIRMFFEEHLHSDEEIRFILEGSGYFDVRDSSDRWVRIEMIPGDLIVLPAGIYHRFTLDTKVRWAVLGVCISSGAQEASWAPDQLNVFETKPSQGKITVSIYSHKNYIKAMRLFQGEPVWTPINRPADDHHSRVHYLQTQTAAA